MPLFPIGDYKMFFNQFKDTFEENFEGSTWPQEALYNDRTEQSWQGKNGWSHTVTIYNNQRVVDRYSFKVSENVSIMAEEYCVPTIWGGMSCTPSFSIEQYGEKRTPFTYNDYNSGRCNDYGSMIDICTGPKYRSAAESFLQGARKAFPGLGLVVRVCEPSIETNLCDPIN